MPRVWLILLEGDMDIQIGFVDGGYVVEVKCFINDVETDILRHAHSMESALNELALVVLQLKSAAGLSEVS